MSELVCAKCRSPLESVEATCCGGEGRAILASVDAEALARDPRIGRLVDGRYQIVAAAGHGGSAVVYRAVHTGLLQTVALKMLATPPDREGALRRRFVREARLVASLRHPAVVGIQDYGVWDRHPYLVMPFIEGGSLSSWVGADEPGLSVRLHAIAELLRALEAAHRIGIIHRDVKPSNVLLEHGHDGTRVLLADFGLAVSSLSDTNLSGSERWVGTPLYMAPEQIAQEIGALGPRTDVYSAGCLAYALLAGRTPHLGHAVPALFYVKTQQPPHPLGPIARFALNAGLIEVIERAVQREPAARWASAAEMRAALLPFLDGMEARQIRGAPSIPAPARDESAPWIEAPPIGREALGRELALVARRALAGPGQVVVLAGQAGMGKTFLARWWMRELASSQSARAFAVGCARRPLPLQPIRAALLELLTRRGLASAEGLAKHLASLPRAAIAPDAAVRLLFPALEDALGATLAPDDLARWLRAEAQSAPLAIFVEDAERADPASVEVFSALAEMLELSPAPILLCCAARIRTAGAVSGEHQGLGRLRGDRVQRIEIGALDRVAIDRLAEAIAPGATPVVTDAVWRRSKGHPLLASSLLKHLAHSPAEVARRPKKSAEGDEDIPADLLPVLLARVDDAAGPDETERKRMHDLLCAVAVLAVVPVSGDVLDAYLDRLGWDPSVRDALLDRATDEELLADVGRGDRGEQLVFSHDLVREALLATLKGRRRQANKLHRAAAEVRAGATDPETLAVIAHHLASAGDLAASADAFVRAARMAELLGGRARADELLSEGISNLGEAEGLLRPVRARLEIARAELALRAVQLAEVRSHAARAIADLESSSGGHEDSVRALRLLARGSASTRESAPIVSTLRSAAERMAREGRPVDAARVLFEAGGVALGARDEKNAEALLRRAAELVRDRLDDDPAELDLYALLGVLPSVLE